MCAARAATCGEYRATLHWIWQAYRSLGCDLKDVLQERDNAASWNVFLFALKTESDETLELVFPFYMEVFADDSYDLLTEFIDNDCYQAEVKKNFRREFLATKLTHRNLACI